MQQEAHCGSGGTKRYRVFLPEWSVQAVAEPCDLGRNSMQRCSHSYLATTIARQKKKKKPTEPGHIPPQLPELAAGPRRIRSSEYQATEYITCSPENWGDRSILP